MTVERVDVAVVGAGASGLAAAGALVRRGLRPVVLHRDARVGETWRRRYDRLHLHTTRRFSGLPGHGIPRACGRFVPKDEYARYLEEYAVRVALDVRPGVEVRAVRPGGGGEARWTLETADGLLGCRAVVVATGRHRIPHLPRFPDAGEFAGPIVHSADYRSGRRFAGRRVLVVGLGNSGAEIAADLAECGAAAVAVAVRTPPPIVPRELAGIPVQVFGILLSPLPGRLVDGGARAARRRAAAELAALGLGTPAWGSFSARRPAVIDVGFLRELRAGRVRVLPDLVRLSPGGAVFADGRAERFDAVVAATGFRPGLEELVPLPGLLDESGLPRSAAPAAYPGLYFAGFVETVRGQLFEAKRESRRLARAVSVYLAGSPEARRRPRAAGSVT